MLEKLFWFGAGYFIARYLILRDGIEIYKAKEAELINAGKEKIGVNTKTPENFADDIDDDEYYPTEYAGYISPFGNY